MLYSFSPSDSCAKYFEQIYVSRETILEERMKAADDKTAASSVFASSYVEVT